MIVKKGLFHNSKESWVWFTQLNSGYVSGDFIRIRNEEHPNNSIVVKCRLADEDYLNLWAKDNTIIYEGGVANLVERRQEIVATISGEDVVFINEHYRSILGITDTNVMNGDDIVLEIKKQKNYLFLFFWSFNRNHPDPEIKITQMLVILFGILGIIVGIIGIIVGIMALP